MKALHLFLYVQRQRGLREGARRGDGWWGGGRERWREEMGEA